MALNNACSIADTARNTGVECSAALKATAQLIIAPKGAIITKTDLLNFTAKVVTMSHAAKALRWYPILGTAAPIRYITNKAGTDVIEKADDGSSQFVRYDMFERTFKTNAGGLCLAQALQSFIGNAYGFIEVDITGQVSMQDNGDGTFSPFPVNLMYAPTPELADFKGVFKTQFMLNFNPLVYIGKGKIFSSDISEDLVDTTGLVDTNVIPAAGATQSVTNIFVSVITDCAETDLATTLPGSMGIAQIANFVVKLAVSPFTVVTPTAILVIAATDTAPAQIKLTGTYVTASSYTVALAASATLLTNGVEGYEGIAKATVAIP